MLIGLAAEEIPVDVTVLLLPESGLPVN